MLCNFCSLTDLFTCKQWKNSLAFNMVFLFTASQILAFGSIGVLLGLCMVMGYCRNHVFYSCCIVYGPIDILLGLSMVMMNCVIRLLCNISVIRWLYCWDHDLLVRILLWVIWLLW